MDKFNLDELLLKEKEKIITFLNKSDNFPISEQIEIAYRNSKELFPDRKIKLELCQDYESGEDTLFFLIESYAEIEKDFSTLRTLYETVKLSERFIVDLWRY